MTTGDYLLRIARPHVGEAYVLGAVVPKSDATWHGPWDCAEFASWVVFQATGRLYGCSSNTAKPHAADAWTGFWRRDADALRVVSVPVEEAIRTPGALLLRYPPPVGRSGVGHIGFSDGVGGCVEAASAKLGVRDDLGARGRRWDVGILIPGVEYATGPAPTGPAPTKWGPLIRLGAKGADVVRLQQALNARGARLTLDGVFGQGTLEAVVAFQRTAGLVVDGDVGPATWAALAVP